MPDAADDLDVNGMLQRFRERADAVKDRPLPPVAGAERQQFIEQAELDYMDYAIVADATWTFEDGDPDLAGGLAPAGLVTPETTDLDAVDHLLSTTRAVRKRLDLDRPVPPEIVEECLRLAIQAPTGSNRQGWRWIVVTDADTRAALGGHVPGRLRAVHATGPAPARKG